MSDIEKATIEIFNKWIAGSVRDYHLSDRERWPRNPFIQSEADIRMKFGGFLQQELLTKYKLFTVHSELMLPDGGGFDRFSGLSIHTISDDSLGGNWQTPNLETARVAIKVRLIDHLASQKKVYDSRDFHIDFACLNELPDYIDRFLLIIDEDESMDSAIIDELRHVSKQFGVWILSNNDWLASGNF